MSLIRRIRSRIGRAERNLAALAQGKARRIRLRLARENVAGPAAFADSYCQIEDPLVSQDEAESAGEGSAGAWIPFRLWDSQREAFAALAERLVVMLKARQLGFTWIVLAFALYLLVVWPGSIVLLFSKTDREAMVMLKRLRGMAKRLPAWLRPGLGDEDNAHIWRLDNGSVCRAFPPNAGDSYAATLAVIDEADLVPDLNKLMGSVKPTIDAGGKLVLLSRANKDKPQSPFKQIYRAARDGRNNYLPVFAPWDARPDRTPAWYADQKRDCLAQTGSLDDLHEQYPATEAEALAPRSLNKRIAPDWLNACFRPVAALDDLTGGPAIPGLKVYEEPVEGRKYVIGADPAEGKENSDDSALAVLDEDGNEVAQLSGRIEPTTFADFATEIARWYNGAGVLCERNNHGHAVIARLRENGTRTLKGHDKNPGWLSNAKGKALMYTAAADAFRQREVTVATFSTLTQLGSIERSTLLAPEGERDDEADAAALAIVALPQAGVEVGKIRVFG